MSDKKLEIPGLLSGKNSKLTEAEIQAQRDMFAKQQALVNQPFKKVLVNRKMQVDNNSIPDSMTATYELTLEQIKDKFGQEGYNQALKAQSQSYVANDQLTGQPYWGIDLGQDWMKQQPYQQPWDIDQYKKKFLDPEPKKYGPSPSRQSGLGSNQDFQAELLKYMQPKKSAFEELLDGMFSVEDKIEFLKNTGYEIENNPHPTKGYETIITKKLASGEVKTITNTFDDLFLKEVTVKFKNLLMMKATLKLKL